jgi:hypothetical protein
VPVKDRAVLKVPVKDNKLVARLSKAVPRPSKVKVKVSRAALKVLKVLVQLRASKVVLKPVALKPVVLKPVALKLVALKLAMHKLLKASKAVLPRAVLLRAEQPKVALLRVLVLLVLLRVNKAKAKVVRVVKAKAGLQLFSKSMIKTVRLTYARTTCSFPFSVCLRMAHGQLICRCSGLEDSGVNCRVAMTFACISFLFARLIP